MKDVINKIKEAFKNSKIIVSIHADRRMKERNFTLKEIMESVDSFEIIEKYEKDSPFPSFLILAKTKKERYFHMVVAYNEKDKEAILITVYEPSLKEWKENFKTRRKK